MRRLGSGGMGVVHLARSAEGELVAIKVMHAELSADPEFRARFRREAEAARRVARFCTAAVLDFSFGEPAYLVTEYVEGRTLGETVAEDGPLRGGALESVAVETAVALAAIHRAGIVHRDLKPGNVILSRYGPKVIDFGIAQLDEAILTRSGTVVGTPAYIAPERIRGGPATPAADVFSWGCVVAFAGRGRHPFGRGSPAEVMYRIAHLAPDLDGLDDRLHPLVQRALSKDPQARPTVQHLLETLVGKGFQPPPRPRRSLWPALALGVAAVSLLATAVFILWPRPPLFDDDFSHQRGWPIASMPEANTRLADGTYRMRVADGRGLPASANVDTSKHADLTITAKVTGEGTYGVWCRGNPPTAPRAKYEFYATSTGEVAIIKRDENGQATDLVPFHRAIEPATSNTLEARCNKNHLTFKVNGRQVAEVEDSTYGPGAVGLVVFARTGTSEAAFDHFTVRD